MKPDPKPARRRSRGYGKRSQRYLDDLWREAIRARDKQCRGASRGGCCGRLEAHHIVRRAKGVLRHVPENGELLCVAHHAWVDTGEGSRWLWDQLSRGRRKLLADLEALTLPDFLRLRGWSRAEFRTNCESALRALIEECLR